MKKIIGKTKLFMDTIVDIKVVTSKSLEETEASINRAFDFFREVERTCSRFSLDSELMKVCKQINKPVAVSPLLFEPLKFALEVAKWTNGLFDPTVGQIMENVGFNQHYLTEELIQNNTSKKVTYSDISLNEEDKTILLKKPLVIDLGAVAKGFAIDLAVNELRQFDGFIVNAGGDLYAGGLDELGDKWKIGIQHPQNKENIIHTLEISNMAICTSGSYERKSGLKPGIHHIINPKNKKSPTELISCSIIAPYAMMADAFSTTCFLMGRKKGLTLLEEVGLEGILISSDLQIYHKGVDTIDY
ncbi:MULTISPECIES: FAD:protein FMN transferase [Bacillaceae]|uniref:FAD:protein FMN transferase n=1 Tax=Gottfriedia luciferensis TaxID=178774 RepID=A0ABX2ZZJ1_9BACI|nr:MULTISPECIES: FAD:protein FMN transferase [Bacillaceae]ODG94060.1 thiamine biosynthesis protein ApbE [Gottfriedia luciferensis]SFC36731.1 thiamine biosynthesis lipoprotein [Bacillus sp. UNCCL81]